MASQQELEALRAQLAAVHAALQLKGDQLSQTERTCQGLQHELRQVPT